jgi:hypothetical protein
MRHGFDGTGTRIGRSVLGAAVIATQLAAALTLLLPLAACGGSPMSVESRYVEPGPTQPTVEQRLALERQKARRGHN